MKKNQELVEVMVPSPTLKAMADILVSQEPGVNISTIVRALSVGRDEALTTIQVALALQGFAQEATKETRYRVEVRESDWYPKTVVYRLNYCRTAIFDNIVEYESEVIHVDNSNVEPRNMTVLGAKEIQTCSITTWEGYARTLDPNYVKLSGTAVPPKQPAPRKQDFSPKC